MTKFKKGEVNPPFSFLGENMANSRLLIGNSSPTATEDTPTNTSRDFGKVLENVYKPGFVDQDNLENTKMAVDRELGEISKAFFQTSERTTDTIKKIETIEIENDHLAARIEEVDFVSKQDDIALAQRIVTVEAEYQAADANLSASIVTETTARTSADSALAQQITTIDAAYKAADTTLNASITSESTARASADSALASQITSVDAAYKAADTTIRASVTTETNARVSADNALSSQITTVESELGDDIAAVQTYATTNINRIDGEVNAVEAKWGVRVNVNNKITGIVLNNNGNQTSFAVQADQFIISDGTTNTGAPFEVIGGVTKIKNASVGNIQSDNWNGSTIGWQILKNGNATFNNVIVRGVVEASSGSFTGNVNATTFTGVGGSTLRMDTLTNSAVTESGGWIRVCDIGGSTFFDDLDNTIDVTINGFIPVAVTGNVDIATVGNLPTTESPPTTTVSTIRQRIFSGNGSYVNVPFSMTRTGAQLKAAGGSIRIYARVLLAANTGHGGGSIASRFDIGDDGRANVSIERNA